MLSLVRKLEADFKALKRHRGKEVRQHTSKAANREPIFAKSRLQNTGIPRPPAQIRMERVAPANRWLARVCNPLPRKLLSARGFYRW